MTLDKEKENNLSHSRLLELLCYDAHTGIFTRNSTRGGVSKGDIAGTVHNLGYINIMLDGVTYAAHRLAWFYCFQEWPAQFLDHIDRNRANNSLDNLRETDRVHNAYNMSIRKDNTTGYKGVSLDKRTGKFTARITINKKPMFLGAFHSAKEASEARELVASKHHGEFYNANCNS